MSETGEVLNQPDYAKQVEVHEAEWGTYTPNIDPTVAARTAEQEANAKRIGKFSIGSVAPDGSRRHSSFDGLNSGLAL